MTAVVAAFLLGIALGASVTARIFWPLYRGAREAWRATEQEELAAKQAADHAIPDSRFVL